MYPRVPPWDMRSGAERGVCWDLFEWSIGEYHDVVRTESLKLGVFLGYTRV